MSDREPNSTWVDISLDGKVFHMKHSVEACMAIDRLHNGTYNTVRHLQALSFEAIASVIAIGCDFNPNQLKQMRNAIYEAGLINLSAPCQNFCMIVANGGKMPDPIEEDPDPLVKTESA